MKKLSIPDWIPSYAILLLTLLLAAGIALFPGLSWIFLLLLCVNIVFCVLNRKRFSPSAAVIFRCLVGALFIYSGFSKGVDPLGTQYVIHDYLEAFNLPWLTGLALLGSFFLNMLEFTLGVLLLFNVKIRYTAWITALMMAFFTVLTLNDAISEPVPDCGCFGKALVITNWQTFYKNLVLDAGVLVVLFSMKNFTSRKSCRTDWSLSAGHQLSGLERRRKAFPRKPAAGASLPYLQGPAHGRGKRIPDVGMSFRGCRVGGEQ